MQPARLGLGLVDAVEVAVSPVLLGGGTPLLPHAAGAAGLNLVKHRIHEETGIVSLESSAA
jgi:dihydrofolate reductase